MRIIILLLMAMAVTAAGQTVTSNNFYMAVSSNNNTTIERLSKQSIKQSLNQIRATAKGDTSGLMKTFIMAYTLVDVVEELNGIVEEQNKKITALERKIEALSQISTNEVYIPPDKRWRSEYNSNAKEAR